MDKVKVGLIGVGGIGSVHLKHLSQHPDVDSVALCDVNAQAVEEKALAMGSSTFYTDVDDLLMNERLDALFICVPPFAHGDIEEKAAERGIHLLVEKPIELDLDKAYAKADAIERAGILHATGYCLRYIDVLDHAKTYLQDKPIAMIRGYYLGGFVPTPWFRQQDKSGGQLVEQATHVLDLMRYIAGDIERVSANMACRVLNVIDQMTIADVTSVNCRFTSGAIGHLDATLTQPDFRAGLEVLGKDFRVEITFSSVVIIEKGKRTEWTTTQDFYGAQDDAFIQAVKQNDPSFIRAPYSEGLKTLAVTLAANASAKTGESLMLSDFYVAK
ncbi:hypothetical protein GCM10011391_16220 [Pullulanibacillus camelliae]|uniref:Gfo/Idh/MocA family oxidoreductase n=1 Tax=Pullulanibacillus camelliae TaxID=1707096 RepID=A0A8J2VRS7_9BACL|nr:Gfo/Idh/MocA family oxidoreductase [Pullulanibacillus camelliae]GGE38178.1 hypothetical protein GCM10011391_16220 [Pullulanibacillus camelliae]